MGNPGEPQTYWQALAQAADRGQLYLNSEAAQECARACENYIDRLKVHRNTALDLAKADGWGEFQSGRELRTILRQKAVGGENNMVDVLQSHIDVVEEMKVVFNKFFTATNAVDDANAAGIKAEGPN